MLSYEHSREEIIGIGLTWRNLAADIADGREYPGCDIIRAFESIDMDLPDDIAHEVGKQLLFRFVELARAAAERAELRALPQDPPIAIKEVQVEVTSLLDRVARALRRRRNLPRDERCVMMALAQLMSDEDPILHWRTCADEVARLSGYQKRSVYEALGKLAAHGWLDIQYNDNGNRIEVIYMRPEVFL